MPSFSTSMDPEQTKKMAWRASPCRRRYSPGAQKEVLMCSDRERRQPRLAEANSDSSRISLLRCMVMSDRSSSGKSFSSCRDGGGEIEIREGCEQHDTCNCKKKKTHVPKVKRYYYYYHYVVIITFIHHYQPMQHLWLQHRQYKVRIWRNAVICTSSICPSPQRDKDLQLSSITADQWVIRARLTLINRPIYNSFVWVSSSSLPPLPALFSDSCLAGIHSLEGRVATILLTGCLRFPELIKQRCCSPCLTVCFLYMVLKPHLHT